MTIINCQFAFAQNVGIGTVTPNPSAQLDVTSTSKGMLVPRMSSVQRTAIATPAKGLLIFDNDTNSFWFYNGATWVNMNAASAGSGWLLGGNTGTNPAAHFIGTTDGQPLKFKINNSTAGEINDGNNTTLGYLAGAAMASNSSTGIGAFSLANTTGFQNTGVGYGTLYSNTTGFSNVAVGTSALYNSSSKSNLVAVGDSALFNNGVGAIDSFKSIGNTAIGSKALFANTSGFFNTAIGSKALFTNTTGNYNTANGFEALYSNTIGVYNNANGFSALYSNTSGLFNAVNGFRALYSNTTGNCNTANGADALYYNINGENNTANGFRSLALNTTGSNNTANGYQALYADTSGSFNTANGSYALYRNTTGSLNTANGKDAFQNFTSGSLNVGDGYNAGFYCTPTANNQIAIGANTGYPTQNSSIIGNGSMAWIGGQVGWSALSDGRIKENIEDNVPGISFIKLLRPVTYNLNIHKQQELMDKMVESNKDIKKDSAFYAHQKEANKDWEGKYDIEKITQTGFVAQEVEAAAKKLNYNFSGVTKQATENGLYSLRYSDFVMPLVKAVQEQQIQIELLKKQNEELIKRVLQLENKK